MLPSCLTCNELFVHVLGGIGGESVVEVGRQEGRLVVDCSGHQQKARGQQQGRLHLATLQQLGMVTHL